MEEKRHPRIENLYVFQEYLVDGLAMVFTSVTGLMIQLRSMKHTSRRYTALSFQFLVSIYDFSNLATLGTFFETERSLPSPVNGDFARGC